MVKSIDVLWLIDNIVTLTTNVFRQCTKPKSKAMAVYVYDKGDVAHVIMNSDILHLNKYFQENN